MHCKIPILLAGGILAAGILGISAPATGQGGPPPGGGAADKPILADGYVAKASTIPETVPTNGSLAAEESVRIVSEISRRLVRIEIAEGAEVKKGDLMFKLDDRDIVAQLEQVQVRRRLAKTTEQRYQDLLAQTAISQQEYDRAKSDLDLIDAEIGVLKVNLDKTEIRAPFDGVTGRRFVSEGAWVESSTLLTTLQSINVIEVNFTLPERYASSLSIGQKFTFRVASLNTDREGEVFVIEPAIDEQTRSLIVQGRVDNRDRTLRPGAFASITFQFNEVSGGVMIPAEAVVPSLRGQSTYVVTDGKATLREIEVGIRSPDNVQVLRGLAEGETVLVTNLLRMRPGVAVELQNVK